MQRQRYYSHPLTCEQCGKTFHASRYDAKYCGPNCRKQASREPERQRRALEHAKGAIAVYLKMQKSESAYQNAVEELAGFLSANSLLQK